LRLIAFFCCDIQTDQGFTGAGNSGNKDNYLALILTCFLYEIFDAL